MCTGRCYRAHVRKFPPMLVSWIASSRRLANRRKNCTYSRWRRTRTDSRQSYGCEALWKAVLSSDFKHEILALRRFPPLNRTDEGYLRIDLEPRRAECRAEYVVESRLRYEEVNMKDLLTVYRRIYRDKGENGMPIERRTYCQPGASMAFLLLRVPSLGDVFVIKPIKNRHAVKFTCGVRSLNLPRGQATGTRRA